MANRSIGDLLPMVGDYQPFPPASRFNLAEKADFELDGPKQK